MPETETPEATRSPVSRENWLPKSVQCLRAYSAKEFAADLIAGVTVGLVALPLAMAFAIASGLPPERGIYCAVFAGFLISALGGSRVQIGGPTGAFVVVIAAIVARHGLSGLLVCTMMAGILLFALGATGLGSAIRFIPRPVVIGFTNGIAVLIASTQIKDFFGLKTGPVPSDFLGRMETLLRAIPSISPAATLCSLLSLAVLILCLRYLPRLPGAIVVLFGGTLLVLVLHLPLETIGSRFGGVPSGLPAFAFPAIHWRTLPQLFSPALTVAFLGAIESLMSAVVADRMSGDKHNPNVELMGQGIANIVSPLFGGLPATGAIARTATNVRSGAKTPVAGMIHALTLLAILLFAAPLAKFIPLPCLAAILMMVSYNMGEWREIPDLLKMTKSDIGVWIVTFALTVFVDLATAVEFGMISAALLYIQKVTVTTTVSRVTNTYVERSRKHSLQSRDIPDYVSIYRLHGPFLFGAADKLAAISQDIAELPLIVILRLRNMTALDATGVQALDDLAKELHATGRTVLFCGARAQPARLIARSELHHRLGPENICDSIETALARAQAIWREQGERVVA